jgi:hypothetical protein
MHLLAKLIARVLFALRGPWSAVRANAGIVALLLIASQWALRSSGVSVLATFIAANGTTANNWNVGGPSGPSWTTDGSGNSTISAATSMNVDSPGTVSIGPSQSTVTSIDGTNQLNLGTGFSNEPIQIGTTGVAAGSQNITIGSAAGTDTISILAPSGAPVSGQLFIQSPNFNLNQPGPIGDTLVLNAMAGGGAAVCTYGDGVMCTTGPIQVQTTSSFLQLDAPALEIGTQAAITTGITIGNANTTAITIGNSSANAAVIVQGAETISLASDTTFVLNSGTSITGEISGNTMFTLAAGGFQPNNSGTISCGTGGTHAIPTNTFSFVVTTGTLSSNCVLNFATNASSGLYFVDLSGATPGATFGIEFENGSATKTFLSSSVLAGTLATVWTHGSNTLSVNY